MAPEKYHTLKAVAKVSNCGFDLFLHLLLYINMQVLTNHVDRTVELYCFEPGTISGVPRSSWTCFY